MKCSKCGADIPEGNRFCAECGTPVKVDNDSSNTNLNTPSVKPVSGLRQANAKGRLKKNLLTILCVVAVAAMVLPLFTLSCSVSSEFFGETSSTESVSGFSALQESFYAILMLVGPVLLIAMNYIKKIEPYQGLLVIIVPLICIFSLIVLIIEARSSNVSAYAEGFGTSIKVGIGVGGIIDLACYIAMIAIGAVKYHNFTFDRAGVERIKNRSTALLNTAVDKASSAAQTITANVQMTAEHTQGAAQTRKTSTSRTEEVLELIKRLSEMKESGILTEEEFMEKKKQLLLEI